MKYLFFIGVIFLPFYGFSQSKYLKLIEKGKYNKAAKKLEKSIRKTPDDVSLNYAYSRLLIDPGYKKNDPKQAYQYILKSKASYHSLDNSKEIHRLNNSSINVESIDQWVDSICNFAYQQLPENDIVSINEFLAFYSESPDRIKQNAVAHRNAMAFKIATKENTVASYQSFIDTYPNAEEKTDAIKKRNKLVYKDVMKSNTLIAYKQFVTDYPDAEDVTEAYDRIYQLAFDDVKAVNNSAGYTKYLELYPKSPYAKEVNGLLSKCQFLENTVVGDVETYEKFIENYPQNPFVSIAIDSITTIATSQQDIDMLSFAASVASERQKGSITLTMRNLYCYDGEWQTINSFYDKYEGLFSEDQISSDKMLARMGDLLQMDYPYKSTYESSYSSYIKAAAPNERAFVALQRMMSPFLKTKDWEGALSILTAYRQYFPENDTRIKTLSELLTQKLDNSIQINDIGRAVNSIEGEEYAPVLSADDKQLYFCGKNRKSNIGGEDIFVSRKSINSWNTATIVKELSSPFSNDAPLNISTDGNTLLTFKSGKICYTEKTSNGWSYPEEFPDVINSAKWQADAMLSANGKALFFTAERQGGYNRYSDRSFEGHGFHGDNQFQSDIYVSLLDENGNWGEPINLGRKINSQFCERTPFLHPDMKTLYFSSDGHGGLGKLDVFKSTRLSDTCWDCWSEPVNLGKEINTPDEDWGYKISTDGDKAYFAKSIGEHEHIYWVKLPLYLRPSSVATVSGKLLDKNNKPVAAQIHWEDLETGKEIGISKIDPEDGNYFMALPLGKMYGYYIDNKDYYPTANSIDLTKKVKPVLIESDLIAISFNEMVENAEPVPINNLFFDFGKSDLLPYSLPELKRVAKIIKSSNLKVQISGHTDNVGSDDDNLTLSQQRAQNVKIYLVQLGCDETRLSTTGYGESKPVASNETDAGRAKNRRVELKLVK